MGSSTSSYTKTALGVIMNEEHPDPQQRLKQFTLLIDGHLKASFPNATSAEKEKLIDPNVTFKIDVDLQEDPKVKQHFRARREVPYDENYKERYKRGIPFNLKFEHSFVTLLLREICDGSNRDKKTGSTEIEEKYKVLLKQYLQTFVPGKKDGAVPPNGLKYDMFSPKMNRAHKHYDIYEASAKEISWSDPIDFVLHNYADRIDVLGILFDFIMSLPEEHFWSMHHNLKYYENMYSSRKDSILITAALSASVDTFGSYLEYYEKHPNHFHFEKESSCRESILHILCSGETNGRAEEKRDEETRLSMLQLVVASGLITEKMKLRQARYPNHRNLTPFYTAIIFGSPKIVSECLLSSIGSVSDSKYHISFALRQEKPMSEARSSWGYSERIKMCWRHVEVGLDHFTDEANEKRDKEAGKQWFESLVFDQGTSERDPWATGAGDAVSLFNSATTTTTTKSNDEPLVKSRKMNPIQTAVVYGQKEVLLSLLSQPGANELKNQPFFVAEVVPQQNDKKPPLFRLVLHTPLSFFDEMKSDVRDHEVRKLLMVNGCNLIPEFDGPDKNIVTTLKEFNADS